MAPFLVHVAAQLAIGQVVGHGAQRPTHVAGKQALGDGAVFHVDTVHQAVLRVVQRGEVVEQLLHVGHHRLRLLLDQQQHRVERHHGAGTGGRVLPAGVVARAAQRSRRRAVLRVPGGGRHGSGREAPVAKGVEAVLDLRLGHVRMRASPAVGAPSGFGNDHGHRE
ncbi:hypothetical protein D3C72_1085300 [compost metagenome]